MKALPEKCFDVFDEFFYSCFSMVRNLKFTKGTTNKKFRVKVEGEQLIEITPKDE